jgi:protein-L-isoaspartate(D-aspartate) O-methyltransferase
VSSWCWTRRTPLAPRERAREVTSPSPSPIPAFERIPREFFAPEALRESAYEDEPLLIGEGQTISQPYIVALTVESLELVGTERVLEIGTGSGYEAATLSEVAAAVCSVERIPSLASFSKENLARAGISSVRVPPLASSPPQVACRVPM